VIRGGVRAVVTPQRSHRGEELRSSPVVKFLRGLLPGTSLIACRSPLDWALPTSSLFVFIKLRHFVQFAVDELEGCFSDTSTATGERAAARRKKTLNDMSPALLALTTKKLPKKTLLSLFSLTRQVPTSDKAASMVRLKVISESPTPDPKVEGSGSISLPRPA